MAASSSAGGALQQQLEDEAERGKHSPTLQTPSLCPLCFLSKELESNKHQNHIFGADSKCQCQSPPLGLSGLDCLFQSLTLDTKIQH